VFSSSKDATASGDASAFAYDFGPKKTSRAPAAARTFGAVQPARKSIVASMTPRHALVRVAIALGSGAVATALVGIAYSWILAIIAGWDAAGLVLVGLSWVDIFTADGVETERRAAADDPGRRFIYALVLLTSATSLLAAVFLQRQASAVAPRLEAVLAALCIGTVALSWILTHTAFTLRYAHLYYREDKGGKGGAEFPGDAIPDYMDFAYFAFTVGMCFQVSDVQVTGQQIRRAVLLHALLSFVYNTAIIAFVLNLVFNLAGTRPF
jgi:uncharacterized membrane protein